VLGHCRQRARPGADAGTDRHAEPADPCAVYSRHHGPTAVLRADVEHDGVFNSDIQRDRGRSRQCDHARRWRCDSVGSEYGDPGRHDVGHDVESGDRLDDFKAGDCKLSIADLFAAATDDILTSVAGESGRHVQPSDVVFARHRTRLDDSVTSGNDDARLDRARRLAECSGRPGSVSVSKTLSS